MGKLDHGYSCVVGLGNRISHTRSSSAQTIWPNKTTYITHNDEKHHRSSDISTGSHLFIAIRWYVPLGKQTTIETKIN